MIPKVGDIITVRTKGREWYAGIEPYDNLSGKVKRLTKGEYFIMDLLPKHIKCLEERGYGRYKHKNIMVPYWACVLERKKHTGSSDFMEVE